MKPKIPVALGGVVTPRSLGLGLGCLPALILAPLILAVLFAAARRLATVLAIFGAIYLLYRIGKRLFRRW